MTSLLRRFFCFLARLCILRHKPLVIGVTGSFGKTTVRHIITEILRRAGRDVWTPEGNYNGEWGFALGVLQVRSGWHNATAWIRSLLGAVWTIMNPRYPHILVLEYGVDHTGEMDIQIDIAEPDIALFTKLSPSHIEWFGTAEKYFAEKEKILRRKTKQTYAIGNADDRHQSDFVCQSWYGSDAKKSDYTIADIHEFPDRTEFTVLHGEEQYSIVTPILGKHHAGLIVGAFMVTLQMDIPPLDIVSFLRHIHLPHARGNTLKWLHDSLVIDGTYNGGFDPIVAGVEMLARLAKTEWRKTIALLGDMRELGALERVRHEELWDKLKTQPIDHYIFVGAVSMEVIKPRIGREWQDKTLFTLDSRVAGEYIRSLIAADPNKYLLFAKWSQNTIYLEEALKYFIFPEEYLKLVRQEDLYVRKKNDFYQMLKV